MAWLNMQVRILAHDGQLPAKQYQLMYNAMKMIFYT